MDKTHNRQRCGGLARPTFTHNTKGRSSGDLKADTIHRMDSIWGPAKGAFLAAKMDLEVLDPESDVACGHLSATLIRGPTGREMVVLGHRQAWLVAMAARQNRVAAGGEGTACTKIGQRGHHA